MRKDLGIAVEQFFATKHCFGELEFPVEELPVNDMRFVQVHSSGRSLGREGAEEEHSGMIHEESSDVVEAVAETRRTLCRRAEEKTCVLDRSPRRNHGSTADVNGGPLRVRTEVVAMPSSAPSADVSSTAVAFVTT